jgi:hypothetical protein
MSRFLKVGTGIIDVKNIRSVFKVDNQDKSTPLKYCLEIHYHSRHNSPVKIHLKDESECDRIINEIIDWERPSFGRW